MLIGGIGFSVSARTANGSYAADTGWRIEAQRAGRWAGAHLPKHSMLSMVNSGAFGYYTPQEVMNLDGVISSYAYADAVCAGHLGRELRSAHVEYLASHSVPPDYQTTEVSVPCWGGRNTILSLARRLEVHRSRPFDLEGREVVFVIWRLPRDLPQRAAGS